METATGPPVALAATGAQDSSSTTSRKYTISSYCVNLKDRMYPVYPHNTRDIHTIRQQMYTGPMSPESDFLTRLPLELIHRILNCMQPEDYAGLASTCRLALQLTNIQAQMEQPKLIWTYLPLDSMDARFSWYVSLAVACKALRKSEQELEDFYFQGCSIRHVAEEDSDLDDHHIDRQTRLCTQTQAMTLTTTSTTTSEAPNTQKPPERKIEEMIISGYLVNLRTDPSPYTREQIYAGPTSPTPNCLTTLPLEIVYEILSCLFPSQYAGLACTCRYALKLTNTHFEMETEKYLWGRGFGVLPHDISDAYFSRNISPAVACRALGEVQRHIGHEFESHGCPPLPDEDESDF